MEQSYEDAVLKTVMFWSDKAFRTKFNQNNGDQSLGGGLTFLLMNKVSDRAQSEVTEDKIKKFESKLTELLMELKDAHEFARTLDVDYHPCRRLSQAAEFAEIDPACFPCKTWTRIEDDNKVLSSYQYGGKIIIL